MSRCIILISFVLSSLSGFSQLDSIKVVRLVESLYKKAELCNENYKQLAFDYAYFKDSINNVMYYDSLEVVSIIKPLYIARNECLEDYQVLNNDFNKLDSLYSEQITNYETMIKVNKRKQRLKNVAIGLVSGISFVIGLLI